MRVSWFFFIKSFSYFVLRTKYRTGYRCADGYHSNSEGSCNYRIYIQLFLLIIICLFSFKKLKTKRKCTQDPKALSSYKIQDLHQVINKENQDILLPTKKSYLRMTFTQNGTDILHKIMKNHILCFIEL